MQVNLREGSRDVRLVQSALVDLVKCNAYANINPMLPPLIGIPAISISRKQTT